MFLIQILVNRYYVMQMKYIVTLLISVVIFTSCGKKGQAPPQSSPKTIQVDGLVLQAIDFSNDLEASGTIVSNEFLELHPETSGRITFLNIPEGKLVQQGTLLATLFNDDLQAQLQKLESQLILAQQTEKRLLELYHAQGVSQQEYDNAVNTVTSLQADINIVKADIRKTQIIAPFTGICGLRNVSIGAYVNNADIITTLQQQGNMKVDFAVPEDYSAVIKKGASVQVIFSNDTSIYDAVIIATEPQANIATRNIKSRAEFKNKNMQLNAGAFAKVLINTSANHKSIVVPSQAIIPDSKGNFIVLIKNNKAVFQLVKTGVRKNGWVEINAGASVNDTVAINGILYLKPNTAAKIASLKTYQELMQTQ